MRKQFGKSKQDKISIGVIVILIITVAIAMLPLETYFRKEKQEDVNVNYKIIDRYNASRDGTVKYILNVLIYDKASSKDIEVVSKQIVENFKKEEDFNALSLFFYDHKGYIPHGLNTLGIATYAPNSDWNSAGDVEAGDYSNMGFRFNLKNKDWEKQPDKKDMKVYTFYKDSYKEFEDKEIYQSKFDIKDKATDMTMEKYDLKRKDVENIIETHIKWQQNNIRPQ